MPSSTHSNPPSKATLTAWFVCALAALFYCYEYLLRIQQSVMIPQLMAHFHASAKQIGYLSAIYYYTYTPMQIAVALLTDFYGSRRVLMFALINCIIGCLIFGASQTLFVAGIGRLFMGLGSAFAFIAALRLASQRLPKQHLSLFVGITTSLGMVGAILGDISMSWAVDRYGWAFVIHTSAIIGLMLLPLFFLFIREKQTTKNTPQNIPIGAFITGLKRVFIRPNIYLLAFIASSLYLSLSVFADVWGIDFLEAKLSITNLQASIYNGFIYGGWLIGGPLHGWLMKNTKHSRRYLAINALLSLLFCLWVLYGHTTTTTTSLLLFLYGFFSSAQILIFSMAIRQTPQQYIATTFGVVNCLVMLIGGLIILPLTAFLLDLRWAGTTLNGIRTYNIANYQYALTIIPIFIGLSAIISGLMLRDKSNAI